MACHDIAHKYFSNVLYNSMHSSDIIHTRMLKLCKWHSYIIIYQQDKYYLHVVFLYDHLLAGLSLSEMVTGNVSKFWLS